MPAFERLIRFETSPNGEVYFGDLGRSTIPPPVGSSMKAYVSFEDLLDGRNPRNVTIQKLLAPLPVDNNSIYCVGLNYRSHSEEASLQIPKYPPLWTKPAASLANPDEEIALNDFCAQSLPDYEGELVFVTARTLKDATPAQAADAILGYTVGNDLSCRLFQLPDRAGGQFFYAKAFDNFAPLGPVLVSPEVYKQSSRRLVTKVNGQVMQDAQVDKDMVFEPAAVLSHMSQGTTIPAFTAVMTGTPAGVGAFRKPKSFLKHGDVVEVSMEGVTTLQNKICFRLGADVPRGKELTCVLFENQYANHCGGVATELGDMVSDKMVEGCSVMRS